MGVTFAKQPTGCVYLADLAGPARLARNRDRQQPGPTPWRPSAPLADPGDDQAEDDAEPHCLTCGLPVHMSIGRQRWHHFRGEGTAASPVCRLSADSVE